MGLNIKSNFEKFLIRQSGRLVTQLDRDSDSPTYGCFDRNYWHYKIRDFPSMILQQGALVLFELYRNKFDGNFFYHSRECKAWINAALDFWVKMQLAGRGTDEYYPYEQGFPPGAFGLYAASLLMRELKVVDETSIRAVQLGVDFLERRWEKDAYNQESAGIAALAISQSLPGIKVDHNALEARTDFFFQSQSEEGWFPEYGGFDLGYLSVTIDCLYDYWEASQDDRAKDAIEKAVRFSTNFNTVGNQIGGQYNSRNTEYFVPYGLCRTGAFMPEAQTLLSNIFGNIHSENHFLNAIDDRYYSHYIFQSCARALPYLSNEVVTGSDLPKDLSTDIYFRHAGIYINHRVEQDTLVIAINKGGLIMVYGKNGLIDANYGYRYQLGKRIFGVTNWVNGDYIHQIDKDLIVVSGHFTKVKLLTSSPFKHVILRAVSWVLGYRIIAFLKRLLIFANKEIPQNFIRTIKIHNDHIQIEDQLRDIDTGNNLRIAPKHSLRHVASSKSFVRDDLLDLQDAVCRKKTQSGLLFIHRIKRIQY